MTVIDTQSRQTFEVPAPPVTDCMFPSEGLAGSSPTIFAACIDTTTPEFARFSLASQTWSPVPVPPELSGEFAICSSGDGCGIDLAILGANWAGWTAPCNGIHCPGVPPVQGYGNLNTGAWVPSKAGAIINPNSPRSPLASRPCRPIQAPPGSVITYHGPIAVVQPQPNGIGYAEKCGSTTRTRVEAALTSSPTLLLAAGDNSSLSGLQIPSGKPFLANFSLPPDPNNPPGVKLNSFWFGVTGNTLWAENNNTIWTAPAAPLTR